MTLRTLGTNVAALNNAFVHFTGAADGSDQSAALQAVADSLATLGGGRIVLPSGTIVGHVSLDAGVTIDGQGEAATILKRPATWDGPVVASKNFATMIATGGAGTTHDMGCSNLAIDGNRAAGGFTAAISGAIPATPTTTTSTTGGTLAAGSYRYRVAPLTAAGVGIASEPTAIQTTTGSTSTVTLTWSAVTGATGYVIYGRVYNGTRMVAVGNVTTWTDDGSLTPLANVNFHYSANCTAPAAVALYGWRPVFRNVHIINAPGPGARMAWRPGSGELPPTGGLSMEAKFSNVAIDNSGTNSLIWEGPHDSTFHNLMAARPGLASGVAVADTDNVVVETGGPLRFVTSHTWGQAKRAFALWGQADLTACQAEGALTAQVFAPCNGTHINGIEVFAPGGASAKGLVFSDSARPTSTITSVSVRGLHAYGFSSSSGAAVELGSLTSGCTVEGVIDQTTGTAVSGTPGSSNHINLRVNGMAGALFQVPGYSMASGINTDSLFRNADVSTMFRRESNMSMSSLGSGVVTAGLAVCQVSGTFTQARLFFTGIGTAVTGAKIGVYNTSGTLISESADFKASITTANAWVTVTLGASLTLAAGDQVFLAFAEAHTTTSVAVRGLGIQALNLWPQTTAEGVIPYRGKGSGSYTGTTGALPGTIDVNGGPGAIPLIELIA